MTLEEIAQAQDDANKSRQKEISDRKAAEIKAGFLNPLGLGTSYAEFLEQVGKKTVAEYCAGKIEDSVIEWIEKELEILKNK